MEWMIILAVAVIIILAFAKPSRTLKEGSSDYRKRGALFTNAERSFLGVLDQALSDQYRVFGKVRVADILTPAKGLDRKKWQIAFNKISSKHFDYVLCSKESLEVVAVIELDDKSHNSKKAQARDSFLEISCKSAELKLIRFEAKSNYQLSAICEKVDLALNSQIIETSLNKPNQQDARKADVSA